MAQPRTVGQERHICRPLLRAKSPSSAAKMKSFAHDACPALLGHDDGVFRTMLPKPVRNEFYHSAILRRPAAQPRSTPARRAQRARLRCSVQPRNSAAASASFSTPRSRGGCVDGFAQRKLRSMSVSGDSPPSILERQAVARSRCKLSRRSDRQLTLRDLSALNPSHSSWKRWFAPVYFELFARAAKIVAATAAARPIAPSSRGVEFRPRFRLAG